MLSKVGFCGILVFGLAIDMVVCRGMFPGCKFLVVILKNLPSLCLLNPMNFRLWHLWIWFERLPQLNVCIRWRLTSALVRSDGGTNETKQTSLHATGQKSVHATGKTLGRSNGSRRRLKARDGKERPASPRLNRHRKLYTLFESFAVSFLRTFLWSINLCTSLLGIGVSLLRRSYFWLWVTCSSIWINLYIYVVSWMHL